jgi:hypothetical protein
MLHSINWINPNGGISGAMVLIQSGFEGP